MLCIGQILSTAALVSGNINMSKEQDTMVAVKVLHTHFVAEYTSDPAADYKVLLHVRENWDIEKQKKFSEELARMNMFYTSWFHHGLMSYQPGNWSRAALKVLGHE